VVIVDFKQIQDLIKGFEQSNITTLELEMDTLKLKLNKQTINQDDVVVIANKSQTTKQDQQKQVDTTSGYEVKSPLVGTFYEASSPKDGPFVKVGQTVKKGDTLCIIEAMKIMNEITAPIDGIINEINIPNGDVVGFGQIIMNIG
jgi:acetyl-CoA carboxylase biotin carboxyl carrier protein